MNRLALALLVIWMSGFRISTRAQGDFLTTGEIDEVRDKQEPDKRIILYLDFAQRRLDAIKENLTAKKAGVGRAVQKNLREYTSVLEALEVTVAEAREKRAVTEKIMKETERREGEFLTYLQSLDAKTAGFDDYRYTLEEAIVLTEEELADAKKGTFPELREREPPRLPATPPPAPRRNASQNDEEGPPRKGRPTR